jgi:hypothetical protein
MMNETEKYFKEPFSFDGSGFSNIGLEGSWY